MYDDFFEPLCDDVGEGFNNPKLSSIVVPLMNCGCDGSDFKGMPKIQLQLGIDEYDTSYAYELDPSDYEMYPKINTINRV